MKGLTVGLVGAACAALLASSAFAQEYRQGYVRRDGTYVQPHFQSSPDRSYNNNWGVQGNVNPYTGAYGTKSPTYNDRTPSYNTRNFGDPGYVGGGRRKSGW